MRRRFWEWAVRNIPWMLVLYYKVCGRTDSDQMKRVFQDIDIKKSRKKALTPAQEMQQENIFVPASIEKIDAVAATVKFNKVKLEWPLIRDAVRNNIYRRVGDGELKYIGYTAESYFVDRTSAPETTYTYRIKSGNAEDIYHSPYNDLKITTCSVPDIMSYNISANLFKLPYTEGAESEYQQRIKPVILARILSVYDMISFDIFDTLILRPFSSPDDLFMLVGHELDIANFHNIRVDAEREAREFAQLTRGNREITIYDIYKIVERETGIEARYGVKIEFETELELCVANPYFKLLFELLKYKGNKLIAVSDMYLPEEMMRKLLKKCGYEEFEYVFVSNEYNCSKSNQKLYEILKNYFKINGDNFIHVGDNPASDITNSEKNGIRTHFYPSVGAKGNQFRASDMSRLIGSAYAGIVNNHLHNGSKSFSPYYEYGFIYAGLYTMGFCVWLHNNAKKNHLDKILLLSREGDIYKKVYDNLFNDIPCEYFYWSRIPAVTVTAAKNRYPYLLQFFTHKNTNKFTLDLIFKQLDIYELLKKYAEKYRLSETEYLNSDNIKIVKSLISDNWDEILKHYDEIDNNICEYITNAVHNCKRVAVVDVGWSGGNVLSIKYLIEKKYRLNCEADCFLTAARTVNNTDTQTLFLDNQVSTYIFSPFENKYIHDMHVKTNKSLNCFLFEMMAQSASPSFVWVKGNEFVFDYSEVENYERVKEIHKGIIDFADIYRKTFSRYPYMFNIGGHDAYMPFLMLIKDLDFIKTYFGDYVFAREVFSNESITVGETLKRLD